MSKKWAFRDVSILLQEIRNFLLGRKHTLHPRFPLKVSPRSIPPADIPRAPEYKYSNQYYYERNAFDSVKPPVVAPVAEGGGLSRNTVAAENGPRNTSGDPCRGAPARAGSCWVRGCGDIPHQGDPAAPHQAVLKVFAGLF
ncbi:unnamed protein product [Chilo suppressalis]|uniref:NADH dehydrogenase [ubiquinone] 1 alpha subcomplex subunit 7 n=1 Tax=Chilo suppressalis TaxID=168631 RepID=A0ABN8L6H0_CHISP|nr:unnamed protein product [Chilo suppressalis]